MISPLFASTSTSYLSDGLSEKISTGYLRGHVVILAWPKSMIGETIKKTFANLIREASF